MKFDVESYVQDNLDSVRRSGKELSANCPSCMKPSHFYVNAETGDFVCFKCDFRGRRAIGLIALIEGLSYSDAAKFILKQSVQFRRKETPESLSTRIAKLRGDAEAESGDETVNFNLPKEFIPVFKKPNEWKFPAYLKKRGFTRETARAWNMGWARRGRYASRIIIPVDCPNGRSFTARAISDKDYPKYLNPPGADHGRLLVGWHHANIREDIVLVEGPFDIAKVWQHGLRGYAVQGKVLHSEQLRLLFRKPAVSSITIMFDPEETEAPYQVARQLLAHFSNISIARLPDGIDPGKSNSSEAWDAYNNSTKFSGERNGLLSDLVVSARKKLEEKYQ